MTGHKPGWIGVDLDGTLAHYDGWKGLTHIGAPVPAMVDRIKGWLAEGHEVRIFTARMAAGHDERGMTARDFIGVLADWLEKAGLPRELRPTNVKDFNMVELYDDRAVQVEVNTGQLVGYSTRERGLA